MIGIEKIGVYLPSKSISTEEILKKFDVDEQFIVQKTGFTSLCRLGENENVTTSCVKAFENLTEDLDPRKFDCVVLVTQNPDSGGLPHGAAKIHAALGLDQDVAAFDISLGCSGYVYALSILRSFMEANGFENGLLFTADPYSKIMREDDKNTQLLFGDGASVTLLSNQPKFKFYGEKFGTLGASGDAIEKQDDGFLEMNGRAVFSFSATTIPNFIKETLQSHGIELEDLDYVLLHQGSKFIVDTIAKKLGLSNEKVPFVAGKTGNLVSSSIPALIDQYQKKLEGKSIICGFGVGLSWGALILEPAD